METSTQAIMWSTAEALLLVVPNATDYDHDDHDHDHDHDHGTDSPATAQPVAAAAGADLILAKVVAMIVLGVVSFTLGALPVKLAKWLRWPTGDAAAAKGGPHKLVISLLLCFGGGVLLYTTFLHLQPEVREGFQALQTAGEIPELKHGIHLAELVFCAGFFFVYLVEELVHAVLDRRPVERADEAVLHRTMSLRRCSRHPQHSGGGEGEGGAGTLIPRVSLGTPPPPGAAPAKKAPADDAATNGSTGSSISASTHGLLNNSSSLSAITILDAKPSPLDAEIRMTGGPLGGGGARGERTTQHGRGRHHGHSHSHGHGHSHSHAVPFHDEDDEDGDSTSSSTVAKSFRGLLAVLALSFHAVFEGLAVGLETSVSNVWYLFAAIATHKLVIAFCVGVELVGSRTRLALLLVYVATFAAVTPLGIGVGIALSGSGSDAGGQDVATVVLQGMAAGTLLYVVFFEVLQRERANTQAGIWQLTAIVAGFAVMFALQVATGHEHNHGGGGSAGGHEHGHGHGSEALLGSHAAHSHAEHAGHAGHVH